MDFFSLNKILITVMFLLFSLSAYPEISNQSGISFQSVCINSWMTKADQVSDKVDYKNFGEKYCNCASSQPLDNDEAVKKAMQFCMSTTLLHDAMNSLEEEIGLSDAKENDLKEYCQNSWSLIYPKQSDEDKKINFAYCECSKTKLLDLIKQSDKITDKQYDEAIDKIAATCSGTINEGQPASTVHSNAVSNN